MRKLILIKHAAPEVVPGVPPERWTLSDKGRAACVPLADRVGAHAPSLVVSSEEPKAMETATLIGARLGIPWETAPGLHEHDRSNVPHLRSSEFISMMELFFRKPDELVLGRETASDARRRFEAALREVVDSHPNETVAVVSHGTVIALLLDAPARPAFQTWRAMGLPSLAVLNLPELDVSETVDRIG
jgi:broad specificity phosphatase PhoE